MPEVKWNRRLTDSEIETVLKSIVEADDADQAVENAIVGVLSIGLMEEYGQTWGEAETIQPTEFAIPTDQWHRICEELAAKGSVNKVLSWVNYGPSASTEQTDG